MFINYPKFALMKIKDGISVALPLLVFSAHMITYFINLVVNDGVSIYESSQDCLYHLLLCFFYVVFLYFLVRILKGKFDFLSCLKYIMFVSIIHSLLYIVDYFSFVADVGSFIYFLEFSIFLWISIIFSRYLFVNGKAYLFSMLMILIFYFPTVILYLTSLLFYMQ